MLHALLSLTVTASLLAGCSPSSSDTIAETDTSTKEETKETTDNTAEAAKETTLTLWSIATESDSFHHAYIQAIADFEVANPGIKIKMETFENQSYKTKIKSAVAANELPIYSIPGAEAFLNLL